MMKRFGLSILALATAGALAACGEGAGNSGEKAATAAAEAPAAPMAVALADPAWDGQKVPQNQWCQKFGGSGATPAMTVSNVPAGASAIVVAFNDESYPAMANGGHGSVRFAVAPGASTVSLPSVPGETDTLPAGVTTEKAHIASDYSGTGGAYLPPCSGGRGNTYTATVTAVDEAGAKLGESRVVMGTY